MTQATVVLIGTLDTKGVEFDFIRHKVRAAGCDVVLVDAGIGLSVPGAPEVSADISREEVAQAAGATVAELAAQHDRGTAVTTMAAGATAIVLNLFKEGRLNGVLGMAAAATRPLRLKPCALCLLVCQSSSSAHWPAATRGPTWARVILP